MHQGADGDIPAIVHLAEDVFRRHADVAEEEFAELALAAHLLQPAHLDTGALHINQQDGKAFVLGNIGVRPDDELAPIGGPSVAVPALLAVYDEAIAVAFRFGRERREIGTGVGFREALAPNLLGAEDFPEIAFLLCFGAEEQERFQTDRLVRAERDGERRFVGGDFLHDGRVGAR